MTARLAIRSKSESQSPGSQNAKTQHHPNDRNIGGQRKGTPWHWNPFWEELLNDRRVPLNKRLKDFYKSYLSTFDDYAWIRVSVYSGLRGNNLVSRYIDMVIERVLHVISLELRYECRLPALAATDIPKLDLELTWNFHSTIIYFLMRRYVFQKEPCDENDAVAEQMVDQILVGTIAVLQQRYRSSVPLKLLRQR
jgi:hypothetical protein